MTFSDFENEIFGLPLFSVRKVNGPGTPRPLSRPKVSLANSLAANGLPDSTDNKDLNTEQEDDDKDSRYVSSPICPAIFFFFSCSAGSYRSSFLPPCLPLFSEASASEGSPGSSVKNKHPDTEEDMEAEQQEVKRLKFSKEEDDDEDEEEDEEEEEQEVDTLRPSHAACLSKEAEAMIHEEEEEEDEEEEKAEYSKENEASTSAATAEDQGNYYHHQY